MSTNQEPKPTLAGVTLFVAGGTRGIGEAIALRAAQDGANVIVTGKTTEEDDKHKGTIYSVAEKIEKAGGKALALVCDVRIEEQVVEAMRQGAEKFGGIDILVYIPSVIILGEMLDQHLTMKRYDLMHDVIARGTYLTCRAAIPYLKQSKNPHILTLSPPLNVKPTWLTGHIAYSSAKFGASMVTMGVAAENKGIGVNALWPETAIDTKAIEHLMGEDGRRHSRTVDIVADAAHWILTQNAADCSGNFFIDSQVLLDSGVTDFSKYAVEPGQDLQLDFYLDKAVTEGVVAKTIPIGVTPAVEFSPCS
jgi:citronellol/citronellal dehydrogenase